MHRFGEDEPNPDFFTRFRSEGVEMVENTVRSDWKTLQSYSCSTLRRLEGERAVVSGIPASVVVRLGRNPG